MSPDDLGKEGWICKPRTEAGTWFVLVFISVPYLPTKRALYFDLPMYQIVVNATGH